jgi:hypothetical protein
VKEERESELTETASDGRVADLPWPCSVCGKGSEWYGVEVIIERGTNRGGEGGAEGGRELWVKRCTNKIVSFDHGTRKRRGRVESGPSKLCSHIPLTIEQRRLGKGAIYRKIGWL